MRHHLLIAGTGRAGTSFLVKYLAALGLDTHLARADTWNETAQAGLEDFVLHSKNPPYVIKSPWLHEHIDQVLARTDIAIDGVIVPVRDIVEAAVSRTTLEIQYAHQTMPFIADEAKMWETHAHTAGGVIFSLNPIDQARLLALGFHDLIHALTRAEIPIYLLAFPRIVQDSAYLFRHLRAALPADITENEARAAFDLTAEAGKARTSEELHPAGAVVVTTRYPDQGVVELAALRRELKQLRKQLVAKQQNVLASVSALASGQYCGAVELLPDKAVVQRFRPYHPIEQLSLQFVTFGKIPDSYAVEWRVIAVVDGAPLELGAGTLPSETLQDWIFVDLPLRDWPDELPDRIEVLFGTGASPEPEAPVGIPLYQPMPDSAEPPVEVDGAPELSGAQIGLRIFYRPLV